MPACGDDNVRSTRESGAENSACLAHLPPPSSKGFTLIELLVAVAVFAIMAAIAYGGLSSVLNAREQTQEAAHRLGKLQLAVSLMSHDVQQAVPRPIRGRYGKTLAALMGSRYRLELTRAGYGNPTGVKRATLQRVAWSVEAGKLVRWSWPVLDRARATSPRRRDLLNGVKALQWRYFAKGVWYESWPPRDRRQASLTLWPAAVEFTLVLEDWGTVTRLMPLVQP